MIITHKRIERTYHSAPCGAWEVNVSIAYTCFNCGCLIVDHNEKECAKCDRCKNPYYGDKSFVDQTPKRTTSLSKARRGFLGHLFHRNKHGV